DLQTSLEVRRSFAKDYSNSISQGTLQPGYGGNFGIGNGYNLAAWRFGAGLVWTYEDPVDVTGTVKSLGEPQRYATGTSTATYLFKGEWAATLAYMDQTLFGEPVNATLGRGASFSLQKRWLR